MCMMVTKYINQKSEPGFSLAVPVPVQHGQANPDFPDGGWKAPAPLFLMHNRNLETLDDP